MRIAHDFILVPSAFSFRGGDLDSLRTRGHVQPPGEEEERQGSRGPGDGPGAAPDEGGSGAFDTGVSL